MKHFLTLLVILLTLQSCKEDTKGQRILSKSSGNINSLSVVISNDLWDSSVGENIRDIIGAPVYGLPQDEPLFTMRQMPTTVFKDFARKNRTVLKIEKGKETDTKFYKNPYARPQQMIVVSGNTNQDIINELKEKGNQIIATFKAEEIKEKQKRIAKSLNKNNNLEKELGIHINFPTVYRVAKEENKFFWIRKDLDTGSVNFMVYELPLDAISKEIDQVINDVVKIRDSVGKTHIPGPVEGTYMITEAAYTPFISKTTIDNKPTYETKSTWEIKGAFMAGPFLNYVIEDLANNRYIVFEGFAFAPSVSKRNYMFELEAIAKSLKIK